jgi:hypothetical protein
MTILCFIGFNWNPAEGADVGNCGKIQIRFKNLLELFMDVYSNPLEAHKII